MTLALVPAPTDDRETTLIAALLVEFIQTLTSKHTQGAYRYDNGLWLRWLAEHNGQARFVNKGAFLKWVGERRRAGDAESTLARRVSAICSFYDYLNELGYVDHNPAALTKRQRPQVDSTTAHSLALSKKQTRRLRKLADADSLRASALVDLLATTGARISEILSANVEDLTYQNGERVLPVTGKGLRRRLLLLTPGTAARLDAYLASRVSEVLPAIAGAPAASAPLFVTSTGRRMHRNQADDDLKRLARQHKSLRPIAERMTAHVLRHSYVTDLLADGVPLFDVQRAVGHADPKTTLRYNHEDLDLTRHPTVRRAEHLR